MTRPQSITWVLVADGSRARILARKGKERHLHPAVAEDFIATNLPSRDLASDRPGRQRAAPGMAMHAMDPRTDAHRLEKADFARALARQLDHAAATGTFDRLVLVAPPQTLGELRAALAEETRRRVAAELAKDLTRMPESEIAARIEEALAA